MSRFWKNKCEEGSNILESPNTSLLKCFSVKTNVFLIFKALCATKWTVNFILLCLTSFQFPQLSESADIFPPLDVQNWRSSFGCLCTDRKKIFNRSRSPQAKAITRVNCLWCEAILKKFQVFLFPHHTTFLKIEHLKDILLVK